MSALVHGGPLFANLHIRLMVGFLVLNCPRVDIMAVVQGARVRKEGVLLEMVEERVQRLGFQGLGSVGRVNQGATLRHGHRHAKLHSQSCSRHSAPPLAIWGWRSTLSLRIPITFNHYWQCLF